jgi:hypothetical protein
VSRAAFFWTVWQWQAIIRLKVLGVADPDGITDDINAVSSFLSAVELLEAILLMV